MDQYDDGVRFHQNVNHGDSKNNETKNFESSSAFMFGPEQMRKLISQRMMGAEGRESDKIDGVAGKKENNEDEELNEKEIKLTEQVVIIILPRIYSRVPNKRSYMWVNIQTSHLCIN